MGIFGDGDYESAVRFGEFKMAVQYCENLYTLRFWIADFE